MSKRKLSIVHVVALFPPSLGGMEKVAHLLAAAQAKAGLHVSVITSNLRAEKSVNTPYDVSRLRGRIIANTIVMPGLLRRLLRLSSAQIVHLHINQAYLPEIVWLASKLRGFRYVAHIHIDIPVSTWRGVVLGVYKRLILKRVLLAAASVVVFTNDQKELTHSKYNVPYERIRVIANGVEDMFYHNQPRSLHSKPRLLFVGRLGFQKNIPLLLHAIEGISAKFETRIVGSGELEQDLKSLAKKLRLQNIEFTGRLDGERLLAQYKWADIFVLPSEREGMPLVLLEALAMGLPVVATDVTGSRDVVCNQQNGLLVPFGDPRAFAGALLGLVADPALFVQFSQTARKMADAYAWDRVSREFESLYRKAVA